MEICCQRKKLPKYIIEDKKFSSDESDKEDSDEESSKEILLEKILMKKSKAFVSVISKAQPIF